MIPSIGRIVHYFTPTGDGPFAAIITGVTTTLPGARGEHVVELTIFKPGAVPFAGGATLFPDPTHRPSGDRGTLPWANWPPRT